MLAEVKGCQSELEQKSRTFFCSPSAANVECLNLDARGPPAAVSGNGGVKVKTGDIRGFNPQISP